LPNGTASHSREDLSPQHHHYKNLKSSLHIMIFWGWT